MSLTDSMEDGKMKKKKTIHELAKLFPEKTYVELEKYRETQEILLKQENEELEEKIGIGHNGPPEDHEEKH